MKLRRVVVVYKKSSYQVYVRERREKHFLRLFRKQHEVVNRLLHSHEDHTNTLAEVHRVLRRQGIAADFVYRASRFSEKKYDLVITVGGDGTFLDASHHVTRLPMLGVNSSPTDSIGSFCGAVRNNLEEKLERIKQGRLVIKEVIRLQVKVGRKILPTAILNDVLVAHQNAAATSRYIIRWKGIVEEHKSSGIWVAPPAGATAGISGAGGKILPIASLNFQFLVRELYRQRAEQLKLQKGIVRPRQRLILYSKMRAGRIYLDGSHLFHSFPLGERAEVTSGAPRLRIYGYDVSRRKLFLR